MKYFFRHKLTCDDPNSKIHLTYANSGCVNKNENSQELMCLNGNWIWFNRQSQWEIVNEIACYNPSGKYFLRVK